MENTKTTNIILDKKLEGYSVNNNNFIADGEITVTITLSEYRELICSKATKDADINKANADKYQRDSENRTLKEEVARLKAEIYELKTTGGDSYVHRMPTDTMPSEMSE